MKYRFVPSFIPTLWVMVLVGCTRVRHHVVVSTSRALVVPVSLSSVLIWYSRDALSLYARTACECRFAQIAQTGTACSLLSPLHNAWTRT